MFSFTSSSLLSRKPTFQYRDRSVGSPGDPIVPDLALLLTDADDSRGWETSSANALLHDEFCLSDALAVLEAPSRHTRARTPLVAERLSPTCAQEKLKQVMGQTSIGKVAQESCS